MPYVTIYLELREINFNGNVSGRYVVLRIGADGVHLTGTGDPNDVFAQHPSCTTTNEDETGVRKASICQSDRSGGYAALSESCGISGALVVSTLKGRRPYVWSWV